MRCGRRRPGLRRADDPHPLTPATHYDTYWTGGGNYKLRELLAYVKDWKPPKRRPQREPRPAAQSRNCHLFDCTVAWAFKNRHHIDEHDIAHRVAQLNTELQHPLGPNEVRGIADSIARYHIDWVVNQLISSREFATYEEFIAWQRENGIWSGIMRRAAPSPATPKPRACGTPAGLPGRFPGN